MATIRLADGGKEFWVPSCLLKILAGHYPGGPQTAGLGNAPQEWMSVIAGCI